MCTTSSLRVTPPKYFGRTEMNKKYKENNSLLVESGKEENV
jgi:hypothetical protein